MAAFVGVLRKPMRGNGLRSASAPPRRPPIGRALYIRTPPGFFPKFTRGGHKTLMGVLSELIRKSGGAADAMAPAARAGGSYQKFRSAVPSGPSSVLDVVAPTGRPYVAPQVVPDDVYIPPAPPAGVDVYVPPAPAGSFPDTDYFPPPPMPVDAYPQVARPASGAARELEIRELIRQQRRDMRSMTVPPEPGRYRDDVFRSIGQGQ